MIDPSNPLHLILTLVAVLLALAFVIRLIVFLVRPSIGRDAFRVAVPLQLSARRNRKNHVFLGVSEYSKLLAAQILQEWKQQKKRRDQGRILFVNLADEFSRQAERQLQQELGSRKLTLLHGGYGAAVLEKLGLWLANTRTNLYLFSDKPEENARLLSLATDYKGIKAKIFFYAAEPGGYDALVASTGTRVRLLNPHQMAFMQLKLTCPEVMPHNYVKKAAMADGTPLGYVKDGLHALVVGFGNTGQEALRFLWEFGSFVGKDCRRAPMSIRVYDPKLEERLGTFLQSAPALKGDPALEWHAESAGSAAFWEAFERDADINYIVVAIDNGPRNIQLGVSLLQAAARCGRDMGRMLILVRNWKQNKKTAEVLDCYNAAYCPEGTRVLRCFGNIRDNWTPDVVSGRRLKKTAQLFYENQKALGVDEDWDARRARLSQPGPDLLRNQQELHRRQAADIGRALFAPTLLAFAPADGTPDASQMEYLSALEHLHWMAALEVIGYTDGPLDELLKKHPNLVPFPDITEERNRSISAMAVRSMLDLRKKPVQGR